MATGGSQYVLENQAYSVVMLSGGIDSTALALHLRQQNIKVRGIFLDFGQSSARRQASCVKRQSIRASFPVEIGYNAWYVRSVPRRAGSTSHHDDRSSTRLGIESRLVR
jgi:hypothetical protein